MAARGTRRRATRGALDFIGPGTTMTAAKISNHATKERGGRTFAGPTTTTAARIHRHASMEGSASTIVG
ncbi:hypothetical protein GUJ93_ZPchr0008g13996 [Zizania palustris]|uniref:Uncharacterized protein n=1 Tax=Zizania palustris TaxID=103762 RepID=A0A8J5V240_ZIZPA|nr:hypothetical protein GUJ93_ZPchr0008g13996 [Zizania palustris]